MGLGAEKTPLQCCASWTSASRGRRGEGAGAAVDCFAKRRGFDWDEVMEKIVVMVLTMPCVRMRKWTTARFGLEDRVYLPSLKKKLQGSQDACSRQTFWSAQTEYGSDTDSFCFSSFFSSPSSSLLCLFVFLFSFPPLPGRSNW